MADKIKSIQEQLFVDKLAKIIEQFEGGQTNGVPLADAIVDSGIIFDLEEAAREEGYNQGYESALDAAAWDASYPND